MQMELSSQNREYLARWIDALSNRVSQDPDAQLARPGGKKAFLTSIGNKYQAELNNLSDTLLREGGWDYKLSGDYVEQGILDIMLKLTTDQPIHRGTQPLLEELADSFDSYNEQRTVYIPLSGVNMTDVDELHFGEVILKKMTEEQKEEVGQSLRSDEDRETFFKTVRVVPHAEVTVSAEPIKAWEIAQDRLRDVLDILRYAMPFLSNEELDPDINLLGLNRAYPPLLAVHSSNVENLFGSFRHIPTDVEISQETLTDLEDVGFFKAVEFAGKDEKTGLELAVLRGIQWAADSQGQRQYGNMLLSLIIALECLLPSERSSGSTWTSEGAALLLGQNPTKRKGIRDKVRGLYRKRNGIVHQGGGEDVTQDDIVWARKLVHNIIQSIINNRDSFVNEAGSYDIASWLEDRKMAGEP
jgi:Apea-like HEPN